ncbi:Microcin C7 self-immunity protein MccF [Pseudoalteromonas holothuriae]|uniref:Microcin C7 self-immunity protein MccF n=1 Tax=Pseudoalteromonas holothuriae TaxID=2963714 RepID=A0A9W4R3D4_9GAMM|nr:MULTISPECIES: S66 peptidase family protein [unclassified Pseudoalteromonas]CAH9063896.1 Microcin C7 self-immunity protein MccF [Pseudoalteromonas sp. CIP111951]CAH9064990.1 Microcin C7 self-immunity protein MccF [Pseudoalteromonas sp. CIP111854]
MKKSKCLKAGSTVAIVSPSWGGPSVFPHIYQQGLHNLAELGFNIVEYPTATMDENKLFLNPKLRANDINKAFLDPQIDAIIATIGGSDSARILKYLDLQAISQHPKLFMGYSDSTSLTTTLNQVGLVTFNGPSVMAGFAQLHNFDTQYQSYILNFLTTNPASRALPVFDSYSHGYPEWAHLENTGMRNPLIKSRGPQVLQGTKSVIGQLFGGCIEVLEMLKGTEYWPAPSFWHTKILFLETSQEKPSVDYVRFWLRNYGVMGVFEKINALLIGRPRDYSDTEQVELENVILSVVKEEFNNQHLVIVANLDFGHTDPQMILPLGLQCSVDAQSGHLTLLEEVFA